MNLRARLSSLLSGAVAAAGPGKRPRLPEDFPDIAEWLMGHEWPLDPNDPNYPMAMASCATVYACITRIANDVAAITPTFYTGQGANKKPVERAPGNLVDVWSKANGTITGFEMERDRQMALDISGSAYLYCERDSDAYPPHGLWNMPSHLVTPVAAPGRRVSEYIWGDQRTRIRASRVLSWRYPHPNHLVFQPGLVGLSPLAPVQNSIMARILMVRWLEVVFKRGGGQSLVLNIKDQSGTGIGDVEGYHRKWQAKYGGDKWIGNPIFLKNVELVSKGLGPHDIKWEEISRQLDLDILRVFHMPPVLLGIKEGGGLSDAGAAVDWQIYALCTLQPRIKLRDAVLTEHYCAMWGEEFSCETDLKQIPAMLDLSLKQAEQVAKLVSGGMWTPNEGREATGKQPDADPESKKLRTKPAPGEFGGNPNDDKNDPEKQPPPRKKAAKAADDGRAAAREREDAKLRPYEASFETVIRAGFRRDAEEVERRIERLAPEGSFRSEGFPYSDLRAAFEDADLLDPTDPELEAEIAEMYRKAMRGRSASAAREVAGEITLDLEAQGLAMLIQQEAASLVTGIRQTTRKQLTEFLHDAVIERQSYADIVAGVREIMKGRLNDAATIARTETNWAYNFAASETWRANGVETKSWLTMGDDAVRESHVACEAEGEIPIDARFSNGLHEPGERAGDPSESINCRCVLQPGRLKARSLDSLFSKQIAAAPEKNGTNGHASIESLLAAR